MDEVHDYQVEIQVNKGSQAIRLFPRLQASTEREARIKAKRYANDRGFYGDFNYRFFDGGPARDDSELIF